MRVELVFLGALRTTPRHRGGPTWPTRPARGFLRRAGTDAPGAGGDPAGRPGRGGAEHFAISSWTNMPAYAMAWPSSTRPTEDEAWLKIRPPASPATPPCRPVMSPQSCIDVDLAYARSGSSTTDMSLHSSPRARHPGDPVNINCQGPPRLRLHRAWAFGEPCAAPATRSPSGSRVARGGCRTGRTPDSGKINAAWTSTSWSASARDRRR